MFKSLINLLFPIICVWCEHEGEYLCPDCKKQINAHPELCPVCHRQTPWGSVCLWCREDLPWVDKISVAFMYESVIKKLIYDLKFYHRYQTWEYLWEKLALLIQSNPLFDPQTTIVTYVPSHRWRRLIEKGYNQSEILAQTVAKQLNTPHLPLLTKIRHTTSQTKLSRAKRKHNLNGAFRYTLIQTLPAHIQTIIIIDDILTTGSTLNEAWTILRASNPKLHIRGVTVGRHAR